MFYFVRANGETLHNNPLKPSYYVPDEPPQHPKKRFNYVQFCLEREIIRIGWPDTGDLTQPSKTGALAEGYTLGIRKPSIQRYLLTFRNIPLGSIILMPNVDNPGDFYMGEVTRTYYYQHDVPEEPYECAHRLGVRWDKDADGQHHVYRANVLGIETQGGGGFWRRAFRAMGEYENSRVVIPHLIAARNLTAAQTKIIVSKDANQANDEKASQRNPAWSRDELILALDLYFHVNPVHTSASHPEIIQLSELLNQLPIHTERPDAARFRNANGVYMKMCNFLRFDPTYIGKGLTAGSKLEEIVWNEFAGQQNRLHAVAQAIRFGALSPELKQYQVEVEPEDEAPEGNIILRLHKIRERNPALVRKKKEEARLKYGVPRCEVCDFAFNERYGPLGDGFIECHHTVPVSHLAPGQTTKLKDLALVCANCHRMLHRGGELLAVSALRALVEGPLYLK